MKKAFFLLVLCLSSMAFAETIHKDNYLICKRSDGDSNFGYVSKLFKDGSVELSRPMKLDSLGMLTSVGQETIRVDVKNCKLQKFADIDETNKDVVCNAGAGFEAIGVSKILGFVQATFEGGKYVIIATEFISKDGEYQNPSTLMLVDKKTCSLDETVDELNVNNISRAPGKEVPEIEGKIQIKNKASKQ